jgi:hypothetical protein
MNVTEKITYDVYRKKSDASLRLATLPGAGLPAHVARKDWVLMPAGKSPLHSDTARDVGAYGYCFFQVVDRAMDDIFVIQDEITLVLATEMQVKLTEGEQARLHYTTTTNVEAWTCWIQGMSHRRQAVTKEQTGLARACWEMALALDPASAALNAMLSFIHCLDARFGWWDDRETAIDKARAYADRAVEIDPGNADAYIASSLILLMERRHDEAVADARKAVQLAPGAADTADLAVLALSGYPQEAIVQSEKAIALSPNYPAVYLGDLGNAYRLAGRTEQAIAAFKVSRPKPQIWLYRSRDHLSGDRPSGGGEAHGRAAIGSPSGFHDRRMAQDPIHSP